MRRLAVLALLPALAQAQGDWTARLVELAPALRACLGPEGPAAYATEVTPEEGGSLAVLLRTPAESVQCRARDGAVLAREALPGAVPPDPAAPAFFLERRCVDARRIDAPDGRVLGWLAYPAC